MLGHQSCVSIRSDPSLSIIGKQKAFNPRASLFDYPLASRVVVSNLSYATNKSSLQKEFSKFGQIVEVTHFSTDCPIIHWRNKLVFCIQLSALLAFLTTYTIFDSLVVDPVNDKAAKMPRGYAFIRYTSQDHAILALENMDQKHLDGRVIIVELAKPQKTDFGRYPRTCEPPSKKEDGTRE